MTEELVRAYLTGEHTHVHPLKALEGCDWKAAGTRVDRAPHTIYKILNHTIYWQDVYLKRMNGKAVISPERPSAGWPGALAPVNERLWQDAFMAFQSGLKKALGIAKDRDLQEKMPTFRNATLGECLVFLALHNSHHIGQIITLRQALGDWPAATDQW